MMNRLLTVSTHEAVTAQLLDELGPRFYSDHNGRWEIEAIILEPGKKDIKLVDRFLVGFQSKGFVGAIFYNCSIKKFWDGSELTTQFCEEFVKKNPNCITSYHYNEERFMPSSLEQLKNNRPYFHYFFESDPVEIAKNYEKIFTVDVLRAIEQKSERKSTEELCSTSPS